MVPVIDALARWLPSRDRLPVEDRASQALVPMEREPAWVASFEELDDRAAPLISFATSREGLSASGSFSDYQGRYGEGGDVWVYSCVSAIAQDVSHVRLRPIDWMTGDEIDAWPHPALEEPYPGVTLRSLVEFVVMDLLLTGNAFLVLDTSAEMHHMPPERIRIYPDSLGHVARYGLLNESGSRETPLDPDYVVHFTLPNPMSRHWGSGPSHALRRSMIIADGEETYLLNFYRDGARPSGFLSFDKDTNYETAKRAVDKFRQEYGGKHRHGRIAALPGASYEPMATTPVEGGIVEVQRLTQQRYMSAYGIPAFRLMDLNDADYANARQQERIYDLKTVLPMAGRIVETLNATRTLVPEPRRVRLDPDQAPVLNNHRDETMLATAATSLVREGLMTITEARQRFYDLGEKPPEESEVQILPHHLTAGVVTANEVRARLGLPPRSDGDDLLMSFGAAPPPSRGQLGTRTFRATLASMLFSDPDIRAHYETEWVTRQQEREQTLESVVAEQLAKMEADLLGIVEGGGTQRSLPAAIVEALERYDYSESAREMVDAILPELMRTMLAEGEIKIQLTGLPPDAFSLQDPNVLRFLEERQIELAGEIEETTRRAVKAQILDALEEQESVEALVKRLKDHGLVAGRARAERIARTETTTAASTASQEAYAQAEAQGVALKKRWLSVGGPNVRPSHRAAENQGAIRNSESFTNGLRYPGDPGATADEKVNCRCDLVPEVGE